MCAKKARKLLRRLDLEVDLFVFSLFILRNWQAQKSTEEVYHNRIELHKYDLLILCVTSVVTDVSPAGGAMGRMQGPESKRSGKSWIDLVSGRER